MRTRAPSSPVEGPSGMDAAPPGSARGDPEIPSRLAGMRRRRQVPYLLVGVLLVLGCVAGAVVVGAQLGHRQPVLVLARPVSVGQELSADDVREVDLSVARDVDALPAASLPQVQGRSFAYSLPAGSVLTKQSLGSARVPPPGQAVAAVGLAAGKFPPQIAPGSRVLVVAASGQDAAGDTSASSSDAAADGSATSWSATVTDVRSRKSAQKTVVAVQLASEDAQQLAATAEDQISIVMAPGGTR